MVKVSEIEDKNVLAEGNYTFKLKKMELKEGKNYPYINCEYVITQGEDAGQVFFDMLSLSKKALFRVKYLLIAFGQEDAELEGITKGVDGEIVVDERTLSEEIEQLIAGREAVAELIVDKDRVNAETGEKYAPRNKVKSYHPVVEAGEEVGWPE